MALAQLSQDTIAAAKLGDQDETLSLLRELSLYAPTTTTTPLPFVLVLIEKRTQQQPAAAGRAGPARLDAAALDRRKGAQGSGKAAAEQRRIGLGKVRRRLIWGGIGDWRDWRRDLEWRGAVAAA